MFFQLFSSLRMQMYFRLSFDSYWRYKSKQNQQDQQTNVLLTTLKMYRKTYVKIQSILLTYSQLVLLIFLQSQLYKLGRNETP